jgi:hypothetical protein
LFRPTPALQATMNRAIAVLSRPGVHVVLGCVLFLALTWPFVAFDSALRTWVYLHVVWVGAVGLLLAMARAERGGGEDAEEELDDG